MEEPPMLLNHFSHEHPLQYIDSRVDRHSLCSACRLPIMPNSSFHHCKTCHFSLHKVCCSMPEKLMHPADPHHSLTLTIPYLEKRNECDACRRAIAGFYYTCTTCSIHYHMLCVTMPLSVKITSSHPHTLKLELEPSYDFECGICEKPCYHGWHYHCRLCEFDAHVSCAVRGADEGTREPESHRSELMELLSEEMKRVEARVLDQDQHQHLDQSIAVSEAFTLPSCHFSDACFSLDISRSSHQVQTQVNDSNLSNEGLKLLKRESFSFGTRVLKRELSLAPSTGICPDVWDELGRDNENTNTNAADDRMDNNKHQANETGNMNLRRPFWSKLLMCS